MANMGNIWDRTSGFIGDHARRVIPVALAAVLLPSVISNVVWGASQQCDGSVNPFVAAIVTVVMTLVTLWAQLALTAMVVVPTEPAGPVATRGIGRAILAMLALLVVFAVATAPVVLGIAASGGTLVHDGCDANATFFTSHPNPFVMLYGILLVVVSAVVSVRLTLLYPVVIGENLAIGAIGRAFRLTRGITWKLIGVWLLFGLVNAIASAAVSSAFGAIFGLLAPNAGPFAVTSILVAILRAAVQTAFTVIVAVFSAQLYVAVTAPRGEQPAA
jgi:hypothetical protein